MQRHLADGAARLEDGDLARQLGLEGLLQEPEAVHVLQLGTRAEPLGAGGAHADVGVPADLAFFHVAGAHAQTDHQVAQLLKKLAGRLGRGNVGLADDLDQRRAAAI